MNEQTAKGASVASEITPSIESRNWFAVHARSRHEKSAYEHLQHRQILSFLPTYRSLRHWKDRRVELELPLFPGYIFVEICAREHLTVLQTPGVIRLVGNSHRATPLDPAQIESLRAGIRSAKIEPHPYLEIGDRVLIKRGPFTGLEGILRLRKNSVSVIVTIEAIAQSFALEVHVDDVEPIQRAWAQAQAIRVKKRQH